VPALETVDLVGVELLSTGGPIHGVGSPPDGDYWETAQLQAIAAANVELADQVKAPGKIGHSDAQRLAGITEGEMPAVGWLDGASFRVSDDGTKLLADAKRVPARTADLIEAGAYRTRSVELSRVTDQKTGKVHDWAVTGLAWLGGKMPAVQTLDDVVALYEREGLDKPDARVFVVYAASDAMPDGVKTCSMKGVSGYSGGDACHVHDGTDTGMAAAMKKATADAAAKRKNAASEIVWDADAGFQDLLSDVQVILNPGPGQNNYWVSDVSLDRTKAIVQDWDADEAWVVPITVAADGTPTVSPSSDWTAAEQAWVKATTEYEQRRRAELDARADIRTVSDETKTFTADQRRAFSEATGLEEAKVTDEMLASAGVPVEGEEPKTEPKVELEADERFRQFETARAADQERIRLLENDVKTEKRTAFVEGVLREGKATPGQRESIEKMYDAAPDVTREFYANAPADDKLALEYGADSDVTEEEAEADNKAYEAEAETRLAIPAGQVL